MKALQELVNLRGTLNAANVQSQRASNGVVSRRVFFLVDSFNTGGTETQAVELARRLDPAHFRVTVGCLRNTGPLRARLDSSIPVVEFYPKGGMKSAGGIYQIARLAAFLRRGKFAVVHTHDLWSNLLGVPAARLAGTPVIVSSRRDLSHDPWYTPRNRMILRRIQRLSAAILVNSQLIREDVLRNDGFSPEKVHVVYNGIDLDRFSVRASRDTLFPTFKECKLVVVVGNMHSEVKGHPWLIRAAADVVRMHPDVRFLLVGDGEMRPAFERLAREAGVDREIVFLGPRQDVPAVLSCCDIAVSSSTAEGFPNAVLEYLAAGLPTIATAVGGTQEIIQDGVTGLLVPPRDERALSAALLRLLADPRAGRSMAVAGGQYVAENFTFPRLLSSITQLYSKLLEKKSRR